MRLVSLKTSGYLDSSRKKETKEEIDVSYYLLSLGSKVMEFVWCIGLKVSPQLVSSELTSKYETFHHQTQTKSKEICFQI